MKQIVEQAARLLPDSEENAGEPPTRRRTAFSMTKMTNKTWRGEAAESWGQFSIDDF